MRPDNIYADCQHAVRPNRVDKDAFRRWVKHLDYIRTLTSFLALVSLPPLFLTWHRILVCSVPNERAGPLSDHAVYGFSDMCLDALSGA